MSAIYGEVAAADPRRAGRVREVLHPLGAGG